MPHQSLFAKMMATLSGVLVFSLILTGLLVPSDAMAQTGDATPTPTQAPAASPTATPVPPMCAEEWEDDDDEDDEERRSGTTFEDVLQEAWEYRGSGSGPRNIVKLKNSRSDKLRVKGSVQVNRIKGDTVTPFNYAIAYSTCGVQAQTLTVALQLNVYREGAPTVAPENYSISVNYGCERCAAIARAIQFVYPVADPSELPEDVRRTARELDRTLREIHRDQNEITLGQAYARVDAVINEFRALAATVGGSVNDNEDRMNAPAAEAESTPSGA